MLFHRLEPSKWQLGKIIYLWISTSSKLHFVSIGFTSDWISLPSMSQARFHHGCSLLEDQINTFVFVFGGNSGSEDLSSIERLNLLDSNYQWTSMVQSLPQTIGWILGTVVQKFDDNYCALIILDYITKRVFSCDGNFEWTSRDVAWTFGDKINSFTKFDASFFGPTQL